MALSDAITGLENDTVFAEWRALRGRSSRSLRRAGRLVEALGLPELLRGVPLLGVVGSKGKGTAAIYASAALASAGLTVGTILSPGVITNLDRIRLNGGTLTDHDYIGVLSKLDGAIRALPPADPEDGYLSPGGLFMIGGLDFLARAGCDAIVVEAGIGGASDELSLFELDTVVVTGVFGEHLNLLGPTVVDVATNKSAVITGATRHAFTVPQSPEVQDVIEARCKDVGIELTILDSRPSTDAEGLYPPGFSGMNAELGATAGLSLAEAITGRRPPEAVIVSTIQSVSYPGRLSIHESGTARVVVDSAVSRAGLASALQFSMQVFGAEPQQVLVSIPRDKDLAGFIAELGDVDTRRIFIALDTHLRYPEPADWPWEWEELADLPALLSAGDTLAVGTVSFSAEVLDALGVRADVLFSVAPPA
jgi:dihydrofolate synthase / folylpolyglutamate synthase